jgi:cbb3-type cytochrome c oxidase subunit III
MRQTVRFVVAGLLAAGLAFFALSCGTKQNSTQTTQNAAVAESIAAAQPVIVNERGQQAFMAYCAMCHGERGAGDGPLASDLQNQKTAVPAHLNDRARLDQIGRKNIYAVIEKGGAHTGRSNLMPAWGEKLSPALIDSITDYVMTLPDLSPPATATIAKYLAAPAGVPEDGRKVFVYYCSGCHGPFGKGDGFNASVLRIKRNVRPRDLTDSTYFAPKTDQRLYETVALGGAHVGKSVYMPAWTFTLTPTQIKSVVSYIRVISRTTPKP